MKRKRVESRNLRNCGQNFYCGNYVWVLYLFLEFRDKVKDWAFLRHKIFIEGPKLEIYLVYGFFYGKMGGAEWSDLSSRCQCLVVCWFRVREPVSNEMKRVCGFLILLFERSVC